MRVTSGIFSRKGDADARLAHALRDVPLFREVHVSDLLDIWRCISEIQVPAGTVICERGDVGNQFYVIKEGSIGIRLGLDIAGVQLRRLGPGDFFGEMSLLTGETRSADVVVLEDAVLWALERADFDTLLSGSIPLLRSINSVLCGRIAQLSLRLEEEEAGKAHGMTGMCFGSYRVIEQIGVGGMAAVYSVTHDVAKTAAAIKVLPGCWGEAPDLRERLKREAAALQRVQHANIIKVLEVGEVEDRLGGGCYLVMEWLPQALDRLLRAQYPVPLSTTTAFRIAKGVSEGLSAVHEVGIVHRDVKPSNILLREEGTPVLTDFGLATALAEAGGAAQLTPSNVIVGTADYIAPEQVAGMQADGRADLYSLGVVLYHMLAGYVPFAGREPMQILNAHVEETPPPLPKNVPPVARVIVEKALQKRRSDRFASAADMAHALQVALEQEESATVTGGLR